MTLPIVGLGAGGHAKVMLEILLSDSRYNVIGLLDADTQLYGQSILETQVLGGDDLLPDLRQQGVEHFFVGIGSVGNSQVRQRLFAYGQQQGLIPVAVIHPQAIVSPSARLGSGITVLAGAIINAQAQIGANVIINTGAIVEHDCIVGDHAHIASRACLCGGVQVGVGAHIGAGATILQGLVIGEAAIVGAGAVVVKEVVPHTLVMGVPAQPQPLGALAKRPS